MKPEDFLLGLMDRQLENTQGTLFSYMTTAARLLYAQNWKSTEIPTVRRLVVKRCWKFWK